MGMFTHHRMRQIQGKKGRDGFKRHIMERTAAEGKEREDLAPIVDKYADELRTLNLSTRQRHREIMDSLRAEGGRVLSDETRERFLRTVRIKPPPPHHPPRGKKRD